MSVSNAKNCLLCGKSFEGYGNICPACTGLTECRVCGHKISTSAELCPSCGAKTLYKEKLELRQREQDQREESKRAERETKEQQEKAWAVSKLLSIIICGGVFFYGLFTYLSDIDQAWGGYDYSSPLSSHEMIVLICLAGGFIGVFADIISILLHKRNQK